MPAKSKAAASRDFTVFISFEAKLWHTIDKLCKNMDAAEPKGARQTAKRSPQSERFVESHGGKLSDIIIYGQDKWARRQRPFGLVKRARRVRLLGQQPKQTKATTRRLAIMNLALN